MQIYNNRKIGFILINSKLKLTTKLFKTGFLMQFYENLTIMSELIKSNSCINCKNILENTCELHEVEVNEKLTCNEFVLKS